MADESIELIMAEIDDPTTQAIARVCLSACTQQIGRAVIAHGLSVDRATVVYRAVSDCMLIAVARAKRAVDEETILVRR